MKVKISVIVPIYKIDYKKLREMIQSLKDQEYKQVEYILVDDGSPDNCGKICDLLCKNDSRFLVIHTENYGVSHARNVGIDNSKGSFIVFVDGDDRLPLRTLNVYDKWISKEQFDLLIGNYQVNDKAVQTTGKHIIFDSKKKLTEIQGSFLSGIGVDGCNYNGAPWGKLYSARLIRDNQIRFDESLPRSQDNEFNFRYMHYVKKCVYLNESVYVYTINNTSAMRKYWPNAVSNAEKLLSKIQSDIKKEENPTQYYSYYYKIGFSKLFDIMNTYLFHTENEEPLRDKLQKLKEICESERYKNIIRNVHVESSKYRRILVSLLRLHAYYIAYLLVVIRKKVQGQM